MDKWVLCHVFMKRRTHADHDATESCKEKKKQAVSSKVRCRLIVAKKFMFFLLFHYQVAMESQRFHPANQNTKKAVVLLATIFSLEKTNPP